MNPFDFQSTPPRHEGPRRMHTTPPTFTMFLRRALGFALLALLPAAGFAQSNPVISAIADITINENTIGNRSFTVSDPDTPAASLVVSGTSGNTNLIDTPQLNFSGTGTNRNLQMSPKPQQFGSAVITVTVSDGALTASTNFTLTVNEVDDPPTISSIANLAVNEDTSGSRTFVIGDSDDAVSGLSLSAVSSDTSLIDSPQISFSGTGSNRTVTLQPKTNENGTATITVGVSDGASTTTTAFTYTVIAVNDPPAVGGGATVTLNDNAPAAIFPSVSITDVDHLNPTSQTLVVTALVESPTDPLGTVDAVFSNNAQSVVITSTPPTATTFIQGLQLFPIANTLPPNTTNEIRASVTVSDPEFTVFQSNIQVRVVSINDAPSVAGSISPATVSEGGTVSPFILASITDVDVDDDTFTLAVEFVDPAQASLGSFSTTPSFGPDNPTILQTQLDNLEFTAASGVLTGSSEIIRLRYRVTDEYGGETSITNTLTITELQSAPEISGVPLQTLNVTDGAGSLIPFPTVFVSDDDQGGNQLVKASLSQTDPSLGTFSTTSLVFQTPAQLTAALRLVTYTPVPGALPINASFNNVLTITVEDDAGLAAVNNNLTLNIKSVNNAPRILNVPAEANQPSLIPPVDPILPFADLGLAHDDTNAVTVTVTLDNPAKGVLTNLGLFVQAGSGQYQASGGASNILASLTNLAYVLNPVFPFPPDDPGGTVFTLTAQDFALLTSSETLAIQIQEEPRNHLVIRAANDGLPGSLGYALTHAGNNDVITFALPSYPATIRMPGSAPNVLIRNLTLKGPGANLLTLSGDGNGDQIPDRQLFDVRAQVVMEGITLARGTAAFGGAAVVRTNGVLILRQAAVVDSVADQYGGAIDVDGGRLVLDGTFIGRNTLSADTGVAGGGVSAFTDEDLVILNSTFAGNVQPNETGDGGGALVVQNRTPGTPMNVFIRHSTFVDNEDASGRASAVLSVDSDTLVRPFNSIFADGSTRNLDVAGGGEFRSQGGNLCDDSTKTILTQQGQSEEVFLLDHVNDATLVDPLLAPVNLAGDPTPFAEPLTGSPAINKGVGSQVLVDQRGVLRNGTPDAGAVEYNALRRLVINEVHLDTPVNFIELYVRRDSAPVDLSPYSLYVDGVRVHDFNAGVVVGTNSVFAAGDAVSPLVAPGFGMVIAFTNTPFMLTSASNLTPVVKPSNTNALLNLDVRGTLELGVVGNTNRFALTAYLGRYLDPATGTNLIALAGNSLSLAPQFRGFALVPHSFILPGPFAGADTTTDLAANPTSPGADAQGTPFGQDNAEPLAVPDIFTVTEDDLGRFDVLANDFDGDGNDRLVVVDVSPASDPGTGDAALTNSALGAEVAIDPAASPLRGEAVVYDPRSTAGLQELPVGVEIIDTFQYEVLDIGSAPVEGYAASGTNTAVTASSHRLATGAVVTLSGASITNYNGSFAITVLDEDTFVIPVAFVDTGSVFGVWETADIRTPTSRSEASVSVRVIGINDPPVAGPDVITNVTEASLVRLMIRPEQAGSSLTFPGDPAPGPDMLTQDILSNDDDVDTDDSWETLRIVGVLPGIHPIDGYTGAAGSSPVTVQAPGHGLVTGTEILIANYGGHPTYNGYHTATVVNADAFTIPVFYVDDDADKGAWVILNESNRYAAVTDVGAGVGLTLRADPTEDHILYDAAASAFLNGLAEDELYTNRFYVAVEDSHGGIGLGPVDVVVRGLNDPPVPGPDPDGLGVLDPLLNASNTLEEVLAGGLDLMYTLPPAGGGSNVVDLYVLDEGGTVAGTLVISNLFVTTEDVPLSIAATNLLANDADIDRIDMLAVTGTETPSREGAAVSLGGGFVLYNPAVSTNLRALAREERIIDTFDIVVSDGMTGGTVTSLVAVLVLGVNDTPDAINDFGVTHEDEIFVFDARTNDIEWDINGTLPDDRLRIVPVTNQPNPGLARVDMTDTSVIHDATVSELLNQLADWQSYTNVFPYTVTDNSFLFAVDDEFYVPRNTAGRILDVLANDRDLTDAGGALSIVDAGPTLRGGTVAIATGAQVLVYSSPTNFTGDDVFRYIIENARGDRQEARVIVRSVVPPLNGVLRTANDRFTVAAGETVTLDVLANDLELPATGAGLTLTRLVSTTGSGQPVLTNNTFRFSATNGLAPVSFVYEVTAGGTATALASVTVDIVERRGTLNIQDDTFSVLPSSLGNELDVLANDGLVTESVAGYRIRAVLDPAANGTVSTNAAATRLVYTPNPGFLGTEQIRYLATDQIGGTGTGTATIAVGRIRVAPDFYKIRASTNALPVSLDVLANDRLMPNPRGTLTLQSVTSAAPTAIGSLAVAGGGTHLAFTASNVLGQADFFYTVADAGTPARTATGRVTLTTVPDGVYANPDLYQVRMDGAGYVLDVLTNDISYPTANKTYSILGIGTGPDAPDHGGSVSIVSNRLVYTPASGFFGEESFTYTMTDSVNTDVTRVTVTVRRGDIFANADEYTVFYEQAPGTNVARSFTLPVLLNDRIQPAFGQILTIDSLGVGTNAPDQGGLVAITPDGQNLTYRPVATATGYVEQFTYEVDDGSDRRGSATVRVRVVNRGSELTALTQDDVFSVARNSRTNRLAVLANDFVLPGSAAGWTLTGVSGTTWGGTAVVSGTSILYTPPTNFVGTDAFTYGVNDGLGGTGIATARVQVGSLPVLDDAYAVLSGSLLNEFDVLANDLLDPAYAGEYTLDSVFGLTEGGSAVTSSVNTVFYTPDPGYAGAYPYAEWFAYRVSDDAGGTVTGRVRVMVFDAENDRDTATITLVVEGRNDPPEIDNPALNLPINDKSSTKPFAGVTITEVDEQLMEKIDVLVTIGDPSRGQLDLLGAFADLGGGQYALTNVTGAGATAALNGLRYVPTENVIPVPTSEVQVFTISVTDNKSPAVIDTNTQIAVTAVNDPPSILGTVADQYASRLVPIDLFSAVLITEVDDLGLQPLAVTVRILQPGNGVLSNLGGFVAQGGGVYAATNLTAAEATARLRGMTFSIGTNTVPAGGSLTTDFRITVEDGFAPPVDDLNTRVIVVSPTATMVRPVDPNLQGSFGLALDTLSDWAVVGAPNAAANGAASGSAFVYRRTPGTTNTWLQVLQLQPGEVDAGDRFGRSVAITPEGIAAGAIGDETTNGVPLGAVYLFDRDLGGANAWGPLMRIQPTNLATAAEFGFSVALEGDLLAVGAPAADLTGTGLVSGAVFLFQRDAGGTNAWGEIARWAPDVPGSAGASAGFSVHLDGDALFVGAPLFDANPLSTNREGAVFVLRRDEGGPDVWGLAQVLVAADTNNAQSFGWAVSADDGLLGVSAPLMAAGGVGEAGQVFLYEEAGGTTGFVFRTQLDRRFDAERRFGNGLSVYAGEVFVGAPHNATAPNVGAAYLYQRTGTSAWSVVTKTFRNAGTQAGLYGSAVALRDGTGLVGAPADNSLVSNRGYAFFYRFGFNRAPVAMGDLPDQFATAGIPFAFAVPPGLFVDPDDGDVVTVEIVLTANSNGLAAAGDTVTGTPQAVAITWADAVASDGIDGMTTLSFRILAGDGTNLTGTLRDRWNLDNFGDDVTNGALAGTVWGGGADPDVDFQSNDEEYVFVTDPNLADLSGLTLTPDGLGNHILTYGRRGNDPTLVFHLEGTTDMVSWSPLVTLINSEVAEYVTEELDLVTISVTVDVNRPILLYRIRVDVP